MTVIIGIEHPETGERAVAADGLSVAGACVCNATTDKLRSSPSGVLVGVAGDHRATNLLEEMLADGQDFTSVREFCKAMREAIVKDGWKPKEEDGAAPQWSSRYVVVDAEGCWDVGRNLDYLRISPGMPAAVGSGACEASAAALALIEDARARREEWSVAKVLVAAVRVAARLDTGVGGEIRIMPWIPRAEDF